MSSPLLTIIERMHTVAEVADLSGHTPAYIARLIEQGELDAIRPANPHGGKGQWRIYPGSVRRWLGVQDLRREARRSKRGDREDQAAKMMITR